MVTWRLSVRSPYAGALQHRGVVCVATGLPRPAAAAKRWHRHRCRAVEESERTVLPSDRREQAKAITLPPGEDHKVLECFANGAEGTCVVLDEDTGEVCGDLAVLESSPLLQPESSTKGAMSVTDTLLLISPFFFWGTSMAAMKELAPHTTPLLLAAWRLIPAGAAVLAWAAKEGRGPPKQLMGWVAVALFGLVDGACFQGFLVEGLQRTAAGLGSVIIDSQPLTVALLASLLFGERLGPLGYAGMGLGVAGLCLLEVPPSLLAALPEAWSAGGGQAAGIAGAAAAAAGAPGEWSIWDSGEWWMLLAAQSMAVGTVMVRWVAKYCDPVIATGWHMVLGGLPLLALSLAQEGDQIPVALSQLTGLDALLLLYVSLLGSAASYGVFFYNASRGNLTALSSLTFLTPMFAAASGYAFLGERLTPLQLFGAAVTLGAVYLINTNHRPKQE
ncbi:hypothetical protein N2152v2_004272 [Parachlorella kessleri]